MIARLRRRLAWLAEAVRVNLREPVPLGPDFPVYFAATVIPPPIYHQETRPTMATRNTRQTGQMQAIDPKDPFDDPTVGDVHEITENPVLDLTAAIETVERRNIEAPSLDVTVNMRLARDPNGERCIRVDIPKFLTAAEAHELVLSLQPAVDAVGTIRQNLGFES